ncbi:MAG: hypothetical protein KKB31_06080, partial [Nanoarchaeota archaeon]|nr:hypothetical protein [Nanoarchaeota archaeon]
MLSTIKHSYACSLLRKREIRIFANGKEILDQHYPLKFPELKSYLRVGHNYSSDFIEKKIEKIKGDYKRLNQLGWKISSKHAPGIAFGGARNEYFLTPIDSTNYDYGDFPRDHFVLIDWIERKIKLNGRNVVEKKWMPLNPKKRERIVKKKITPFQIDKIQSSWENDFHNNLPSFLKEKKEQLKEIPEAIVGITINGEICCLDPSSDVAIRANIAGMSGMGKSQTKNNLQGQLYHKPIHNCNIFEINDVKYDTQTYCMTWDKEHPYYQELQLFNEPSVPLPYIYLHPTMKNIQDENILYRDEVGFEIAFPFKDFLLDPKLMEFNKQWATTPASRKHIKNLIEDNEGNIKQDGLLLQDSLEGIQQLINRTIDVGDPSSKLRDSIFTLIKDVWSRKILDINSGITSKWFAKLGDTKYAYPSWDICLLFGLIPSFITS